MASQESTTKDVKILQPIAPFWLFGADICDDFFWEVIQFWCITDTVISGADPILTIWEWFTEFVYFLIILNIGEGMMLKLVIFWATFNVHFCQYQQGSPHKRLLRFGRSAGGN